MKIGAQKIAAPALFGLAAMAWAAAPTASAPSPKSAAAEYPGLPVTLTFNGPLSDALGQLRARTGMSILPGEQMGNGRSVSFDFHDRPFWEVVLATMDKDWRRDSVIWNMAPTYSDTLDRFAGRVSTSGAFLILATRIAHQADYTRSGTPGDEIERIAIDARVLADPSARIAYVAALSVPTVAVDDLGNNLIIPTPLPAGLWDRTLPLSSQTLRFNAPTAQIIIRRPEAPFTGNAGHMLKILEGTIPAAIPVMETITMDVPGSAARQFGDVVANFDCPAPRDSTIRPDLNPPTVVIHCLFLRPPNISDADWASLDSRFAATSMAIVDADGNHWEPGSVASNGDATKREMSLLLRPGRGKMTAGPGLKATFEVPAQIKPVLIPYHFENLPLP